MSVEDVIKEVKQIAAVCRTLSSVPGLSALAIEADVLDSWTANDDIIRRIYSTVESGISMGVALIQMMKEQNLTEALSWFMSKGGKLLPH